MLTLLQSPCGEHPALADLGDDRCDVAPFGRGPRARLDEGTNPHEIAEGFQREPERGELGRDVDAVLVLLGQGDEIDRQAGIGEGRSKSSGVLGWPRTSAISRS